MCGIAGWYRRKGRSVLQQVIAAQCNAILHRGPDDGGVLVNGDFGFGMRRLSILDIAGGHQPIETPDGRYVIVFNGEIYNHLDLRARLPDYPFATHSDTETILAAYATWGDDAWGELEGMFAVAIWDRQTRALTLARDPIGIKPLYVTEQQGGLAFASELKALRGLPDHRFTVNDRAVHDFFSFGHVRKPRSIFAEVHMLEPGHALTIGPDGAARTTRFWRPRFQAERGVSTRVWVERMREMLLATTARHMQADVPVAAFLSGGIDSSAVLAAMTKAPTHTGAAPIKAFTIAYPGAKIDEAAAAREIAQHLGAEHIVLPLELTAGIDLLPEVQRCFDEPFADMAAIPTWCVSKLAAEHVKVVLCGEGGDELFAGYKRHRNARMIERHRGLLGRLSAFGSRLPATGSTRIDYTRQHARRLAEMLTLPDGYQQFFAATQISRAAVRRDVYADDFLARFAEADSYAELEQEYFAEADPKLSALDQFLLGDLTVNMPSAMLTRVDRTSMAHSLEARVPFLSHKLVDWALTVPGDLKLRGTTGKFILRRAIAPWLPPSVMKRPKQGFQMPLASWFRGAFGEFARELWNESGAAAAGYLDRPIVEHLFAEHRRGEADHSRLLYAIAIFSLWWRDTRPGFQTVHAA